MKKNLYQIALFPALVLLGLISYGVAVLLQAPAIFQNIIIVATIVVGSLELVVETLRALWRREFALDYLALMSITLSLIMGEYLTGAIIVLMLSGGTALEHVARLRAERSLKELTERIPTHVLREVRGETVKVPLVDIKPGDVIRVRTGEVVPLDGALLTSEAIIDESSLTGEPYPVTKRSGARVMSGTVNVGQTLSFKASTAVGDSIYQRIVLLVAKAQEAHSPFVRLANRYSLVFTAVALAIGLTAWGISGAPERLLAVLVLATPCPLLLATPIALLSGVNRAARERIIVKGMATLEQLEQVNSLAFDKTGTLSWGKPHVTHIELRSARYSKNDVLAIARALEQNSLHPLAQALRRRAEEEKVQLWTAEDLTEKPGWGVSGRIGKKQYSLTRARGTTSMATALYENEDLLARIMFRDELKPEAKDVAERLNRSGYRLSIFTGDSAAVARELTADFTQPISIHGNCSPEDKARLLLALKQNGERVAMVGDGINDAPSLAQADVGMVFSHDEHTAASEAADVVFLGGELTMVERALTIAKETIATARRAIQLGISLSLAGMIIAAAGFIPPVFGALIQEGIDVAVILYTLFQSGRLSSSSQRSKSGTF